MSQFEFRGTSRTGETITGVRSAPSRAALDSTLRRESITPLKIVEKGREIAIPRFKWGEKVIA
jgi:type II secretory pathway component PulF